MLLEITMSVFMCMFLCVRLQLHFISRKADRLNIKKKGMCLKEDEGEGAGVPRVRSRLCMCTGLNGVPQ